MPTLEAHATVGFWFETSNYDDYHDLNAVICIRDNYAFDEQNALALTTNVKFNEATAASLKAWVTANNSAIKQKIMNMSILYVGGNYDSLIQQVLDDLDSFAVAS